MVTIFLRRGAITLGTDAGGVAMLQLMAMGQAVYQQGGAAGAPSGEPAAEPKKGDDDTVIEADFTDSNPNEPKK